MFNLFINNFKPITFKLGMGLFEMFIYLYDSVLNQSFNILWVNLLVFTFSCYVCFMFSSCLIVVIYFPPKCKSAVKTNIVWLCAVPFWGLYHIMWHHFTSNFNTIYTYHLHIVTSIRETLSRICLLKLSTCYTWKFMLISHAVHYILYIISERLSTLLHSRVGEQWPSTHLCM